MERSALVERRNYNSKPEIDNSIIIKSCHLPKFNQITKLVFYKIIKYYSHG